MSITLSSAARTGETGASANGAKFRAVDNRLSELVAHPVDACGKRAPGLHFKGFWNARGRR